MTIANPIRYPNAGSRDLMTRRGWWLVALNLLMPGSAQVLAGSRKLGRFGLVTTFLLWLGALTIFIVYLVKPTAVVGFFTQTFALWVLQFVLALYAILWVLLTLDTLRLVRLIRAHPPARAACLDSASKRASGFTLMPLIASRL